MTSGGAAVQDLLLSRLSSSVVAREGVGWPPIASTRSACGQAGVMQSQHSAAAASMMSSSVTPGEAVVAGVQ